MARKLNFDFSITAAAPSKAAAKEADGFDTDFDAMLAGLSKATADLDL